MSLSPPQFKRRRMGFYLGVYFACIFLGGALVAPWLYWMTQRAGLRVPFHRCLDRALLGLALIGLWPLLRGCGLWTARELGLTPVKFAPRHLAGGFFLGFLSLALVAALAVWNGSRSFVFDHPGASLSHYLVGATSSALIVAFLEEILFRGAFFGLLRKMQPWPVALIVSSLVYALAHFLHKTDLAGPVQWTSGFILLPKMLQGGLPIFPAVLTLFLAGATLALAYQQTGTLYFSMGLHAGWIFWLKSYGFFTTPTAHSQPALWGTNALIDGWLVLPIMALILAGVFGWRRHLAARK